MRRLSRCDVGSSGGSYILAGEITAYDKLKKQKNDLTTQIERDKKGRPTQAQIDLLIKLKQSYQETINTAEEKLKYQETAQLAFVAAAIAAGIMGLTDATCDIWAGACSAANVAYCFVCGPAITGTQTVITALGLTILASMGVLDPLAAAMTLGISWVFTISMVTIASSAFGRMAVWIALGLVAGEAMKATNTQITKMKANITKIDVIINSMNTLGNGVATKNAPNAVIKVGLTPFALNNQNAIGDLVLDKPLPCATGNGSGTCASLSDQLTNNPSFSSMPDFMQQQIRTIGKIGDGLSGRTNISSATLNSMAGSGDKAISLKKTLAKQLKETQAQLKASGSNVNLADESAKMKATLDGIVQKQFKAHNISAGEMLASFGGGSALVATDTNGNVKVNIPTVATAKFAMPRIKLEEEKMEEAPIADSAKAAGSMDEYDIKNDDITKDKGASIFELLSNRYQKSGYPRLFKKLE